MRTTQLHWAEYRSFYDLAAKPRTLESLVALYQSIFGDPKVWGESWSRDDVIAKLVAELSHDACLRVCMRADGEVVAFCWAQALSRDAILRAIRSIKYYKEAGAPDLHDDLHQAVGDGRIIYVHELAVAPAYRGRVSLTELVCPGLGALSLRTGLCRVAFWSVAGTMMSRLARRARFKREFCTHGIEFYVGKFAPQCTLSWQVPADMPLAA